MRLDWDNIREIGDSLTRNRSRSILTGFGIFWGLFMLLFLSNGGDGLKCILNKQFEGFATNTVIMWPEQTTKTWKGYRQGRYWSLDIKDIPRLKMMIPELETVTPMIGVWAQQSTYGANSISATVKGVYADYTNVESPELKFGRFLNGTDCSAERKVCVIGKRVWTSLFPDGSDPCGKFIKVGPAYYRVIGVNVASGNFNIQGSNDQAIYVPLPIVQKIYNRGESIEIIAATGKEGVVMSTLEGRIREVVSRRHIFDPTDKQALGILNAEEIFMVMDNLMKGVTFLIWLVGIGTILSGAIGVSNIMMVTVKERTTEIGIRRAIGATPMQILSQIISESICLTLIAGSGGIVFSALLLNLLEKIVSKGEIGFIPFQMGFWTAVMTALMLSVLGAVAGLAPALRAMKIKPVDAMRDE